MPQGFRVGPLDLHCPLGGPDPDVERVSDSRWVVGKSLWRTSTVGGDQRELRWFLRLRLFYVAECAGRHEGRDSWSRFLYKILYVLGNRFVPTSFDVRTRGGGTTESSWLKDTSCLRRRSTTVPLVPTSLTSKGPRPQATHTHLRSRVGPYVVRWLFTDIFLTYKQRSWGWCGAVRHDLVSRRTPGL